MIPTSLSFRSSETDSSGFVRLSQQKPSLIRLLLDLVVTVDYQDHFATENNLDILPRVIRRRQADPPPGIRFPIHYLGL